MFQEVEKQVLRFTFVLLPEAQFYSAVFTNTEGNNKKGNSEDSGPTLASTG